MEKLSAELEHKNILSHYRHLMDALNPESKEDQEIVKKAFRIASEAHKDMRRKSGEPYIIHPIEVATIAVEEIGLGTTSVVCALLHDVVEDTDYTLEDIEVLFGKKYAAIIDGLTKISGIDVSKKENSLQAENFRKILLTLSDDVRVILLKIADRLHNMRTLDSMPQEKKMKIISETIYLYAPLAHRLGLFSIKSELEDLWLKYSKPEIYNTISKQITESEEELTHFIERFLYPIRKNLDDIHLNYHIAYRFKSINSIWHKMQRQGVSFNEIYDRFAIRIILNSPLVSEKYDCWQVYTVVTSHYRPKPDRLRDWISTPKANGYESLHTTVMSNIGKWVEVQVRSHRMDDIAERGYAAHWKYKEDNTQNNQSSGLDEWLSKISRILKNPQSDSDALDFLDDFKANLFSDEIYAYTPEGKVINLPTNATTLDFAYHVHTQIGNKAIGAKINHQLVSLNTKIKSGDQIEVITTSSQMPKDEWLNYVVTAKAKSKIKNGIKEYRKSFLEEGKKKYESLFLELKIKDYHKYKKQFKTYLDISTDIDFYYKLYEGSIGLDDIKRFLNKGNSSNSWYNILLRPFSKGRSFKKDKDLSDQIREKIRTTPGALTLSRNPGDINYEFSECCAPLPGDDVVGIVDKNKNIKIHLTNCPEAIRTMSTFGKNIVKAKWTAKESISFLTGIQFSGTDQFGILSKITTSISEDMNINIRSLSIESSEGMMSGYAMLYVQNTNHLKNLIKEIKKVEGIYEVKRINKPITKVIQDNN